MTIALAEIELTNVPLVKAVDILAAVAGSPITLDVDAMAQLEVGLRDTVSLRQSSTTVGEALRATVAQRGLVVTLDNGLAVVTAPPTYRESQRKARYAVADLVGQEPATAAELHGACQAVGGPGVLERKWRSGDD